MKKLGLLMALGLLGSNSYADISLSQMQTIIEEMVRDSGLR